jgi:hypothetical protein
MATQLSAAVALEQKLQDQATASPAAPTASASNAGAAGAAGGEAVPAAWKSFSVEQLAAIETARAADRSKGLLVKDPKGTYGLICRACAKPNSCDVSFCTGCSFPSQPEDVQRLPDNIFGLVSEREGSARFAIGIVRRCSLLTEVGFCLCCVVCCCLTPHLSPHPQLVFEDNAVHSACCAAE